MMIPIHDAEGEVMAGVPTLPTLQPGDLVNLAGTQAKRARITGRIFTRTKAPRSGTWVLELVGYTGIAIP